MYCLCVNVYCHRVTTQLQLINISYLNKRIGCERRAWVALCWYYQCTDLALLGQRSADSSYQEQKHKQILATCLEYSDQASHMSIDDKLQCAQPY
jgi:hypothetical protein